MKRSYLFIAILLITTSAVAQDIIVMKNGDVIQSKILKITKNEIEYKKFSNPDGPTYITEKSEVFVINYENGEKDVMASEQATKKENGTTSDGNTVSSEIKRKNSVTINAFNNDSIKYTNKKKQTKAKEAKNVFCLWHMTDDSQLCDENIEIEHISSSINYGWEDPRLTSRNMNIIIESADEQPYTENPQGIKVKITNKTGENIYIDLGNSFFIRQGVSSSYYIPQSTTSGKNSSTGGSINLGSITGALGIGGVSGQLANGINVGGSGGTSTSTTTYSQRVLSIPPHSIAFLPLQEISPYKNLDIISKSLKVTGNAPQTMVQTIQLWPCEQYKTLKNGDVLNYEELDRYSENLPKWGTHITYSFNEQCTTSSSLRTSFYIGKIAGGELKDMSIIGKNIGFEAVPYYNKE